MLRVRGEERQRLNSAGAPMARSNGPIGFTELSSLTGDGHHAPLHFPIIDGVFDSEGA